MRCPPPAVHVCGLFAFQRKAFPERPCMRPFLRFRPNWKGATYPAKTLLTNEHTFLYHFPSLWNVNI